jgi:hypothetical protein
VDAVARHYADDRMHRNHAIAPHTANGTLSFRLQPPLLPEAIVAQIVEAAVPRVAQGKTVGVDVAPARGGARASTRDGRRATQGGLSEIHGKTNLNPRPLVRHALHPGKAWAGRFVQRRQTVRRIRKEQSAVIPHLAIRASIRSGSTQPTTQIGSGK